MILKEKNKLMFVILLVSFFLVASFVSAGYIRSGVQYSSPGLGGTFGSTGYADNSCDESGQDFIIQIPPLGCEPLPVRSDLLEEENVPVFCQLDATKINPLIDVEAIEHITFSGQYPPEVSGVGFYPAQAALGNEKGRLNSPLFNNIGYAVIVLKQQPEESKMPEYVEGTLTAKLRYDINDAFGVGKASFYLPIMDNDEWEDKKNQYSFWNGRAYMRAERIENNEATISLYDNSRKLSTVNLEKGKASHNIYLPGFDCLAGLKLTLNGLENPDTRAKLNINGEIVEVGSGERFLDNKCRVVGTPVKRGLSQNVRISCNVDEGNGDFELVVSPQVELEINGESREVGIGDYLYEYKKDDKIKYVYIGFIGTAIGSGNNVGKLYVRFFESPVKQDKLSSGDLSDIARYDAFFKVSDSASEIRRGMENGVKTTFRWGAVAWDRIVDGEFYEVLKHGTSEDIFGKIVSIVGFVGPADSGFSDQTRKDYYDLAMEDYDKILSAYYNEIYIEGTKGDRDITFGEEALYQKVKLADKAGQKGSLADFCEEFKSRYPDAKRDLSFCEEYKISSLDFSVADVSIGGRTKIISFEDIYEPSYNDYGVEVRINSLGTDPVPMRKNQLVYLSDSEIGKSTSTSSSSLGDYVFTTNRNKADVKRVVEQRFGSDCARYADDVFDVAVDKGIDPLLLMAIMKQESNCNPTPEDAGAGCNGLMQVCSWTVCRDIGVASIKDVTGTDNVKKNIECGALILKDKEKIAKNRYGNGAMRYECPEYTFTVTPKYIGKTEKAIKEDYIGWERYVRLYNGDSCAKMKDDGTESLADHDYVEKVLANFVQLGGTTTITTTSAGDYIRLVEINEDFAKFDIRVRGSAKNSLKVNLNEVQAVGDYEIRVTDINLKQFARVSVNPSIENTGTEVEIPFKIGIEKRRIKLTPEKAEEEIQELNDKVARWKSISNKLGNFVTGMKTACIATQVGLTVKNFLENAIGTSGKGIARRQVMRGENGWYEQCNRMSGSDKTYKNIDVCLADNSPTIENEIDEYLGKMQSSDEFFKKAQEGSGITTKDALGGRNVNDDALLRSIVPDLKTDLIDKIGDMSVSVGGNDVLASEIFKNLNENNTDVEQLRAFRINVELLSSNSPTLKRMAESELQKELGELYVNTKKEREIKDVKSRYKTGPVDSGSTKKNLLEIKFSQDATFKDYPELSISPPSLIGPDVPSRVFHDEGTGREYLIVLDGKDNIKATYSISGDNTLTQIYGKNKDGTDNSEDINPLGLKYIRREASSYENLYKNPEVRYFETQPYKGYPSVVPFDIQNGWYVSVRQGAPTSLFNKELKSYEDSGRVVSLYLCNVMEDGLEEFRGGGDECRGFINRQSYEQFPGLEDAETRVFVGRAVDAVAEAQRKYGSGIDFVTIDGKRIPVGEPAADIPDLTCQDVYSAAECKLLFNVCDPVICPSSRCDMGGKYPVKDVIQTGIAGSVVLCAHNFIGTGGDVYIPVCLSGINAGIDGWVSVLEAKQKCLQDSIDTGKMTGICDMIYSQYQCEFFFRQTLPLAKFGLNKVLEIGAGQNVRGGGEYLGVANAWETASQSMSYFNQYYAENSFNAFKARSSEQVGTAACKGFISMVYPSGGDVLSTLTERDSPWMGSARFDEVPLTDSTNPPTSHYKVYFHIFAGKDSRAFYKVYLKGGTDTSFYQDTALTRFVDSGYIAAGEFVDKAPDFSAPSGYQQVCISVNGDERCGFKEVSTDFVTNYVNDKFMAEQAAQENIKTERECVAGTSSIYSFITPNTVTGVEGLTSPELYQGGAEEFVNPAIYDRGLVRVCATSNPGKGTDTRIDTESQRWQKVGDCGDVSSTMKCWLDTDSVKEIIKHQGIEDEVLEKHADDQLKKLRNEKGYISQGRFEDVRKNVTELIEKWKFQKAIDEVDEYIGKVFLNIEKSWMHLLRGNAYHGLVDRVTPIRSREDILRELEDGTSVGKIEFPDSTFPSVEKDTSTRNQMIMELIEEDFREEDFEDLSDEDVSRVYDPVIGKAAEFTIYEFNPGGVGGVLMHSYYQYQIDQPRRWSFAVKQGALGIGEMRDYSESVFNFDTTARDNVIWSRDGALAVYVFDLRAESHPLGLQFLMDELARDVEEKTTSCLWGLSCPTLSTERTLLDHEGIFKLEEIYFRFGDNGWEWTPDQDTWMSVLRTDFDLAKQDNQPCSPWNRFIDYKLTTDHVKLIENLRAAEGGLFGTVGSSLGGSVMIFNPRGNFNTPFNRAEICAKGNAVGGGNPIPPS